MTVLNGACGHGHSQLQKVQTSLPCFDTWPLGKRSYQFNAITGLHVKGTGGPLRLTRKELGAKTFWFPKENDREHKALPEVGVSKGRHSG